MGTAEATVPAVVQAVPERAAAARWAIAVAFAIAGATIATFSVRTPSLKAVHGLSSGELGLLATVFGLAGLAALQVLGGLAARWGSAGIVRVAVVAMPLALVLVAIAPGLPGLIPAMVVFGTVNGALDTAMNAHGVAVERALGRPILNSCHAAWSIGAVLGSLAGGAAAQADWSMARQYAVVAAVLGVLGLVAGARLLPAQADRRAATRAGARLGWRAGWSRRVVLLGAMGATVLACEVAVASWSGVLLHERLGAAMGAASLGYIAFMVCETGGRLVGDRIYQRYPARLLIRAGTMIGAAGLVLAVASRWTAGAVVGFAVLGIGLATPLPVLFSVVGHLGSREGAAGMVARFSTMTYSGVLLAPAAIGWIAQAVGLAWTLAALIPLLLLVAVTARLADPDGA